MTRGPLHPALDSEALFAKSRLYISKALTRKNEGDLDEYQLWASLALELVGKSFLASFHQSLIVDPNHSPSMLAASRINISSDIKTIPAKALFERIRHIEKDFDSKTKEFCDNISNRRNSELHSGETPFRSMQLVAWESQYWHAAYTILLSMGRSLDDWIGVGKAETTKSVLLEAAEVKRQAVIARIERAREAFKSRDKGQQKAALLEAERKSASHYRDLFSLSSDAEWSTKCPACGSKSYLAGMLVSEEVVDTQHDEYSAWEQVERQFSAEQFHCPTCRLFLDGVEELEAAQLELENTETDEREMTYEPDYGND